MVTVMNNLHDINLHTTHPNNKSVMLSYEHTHKYTHTHTRAHTHTHTLTNKQTNKLNKTRSTWHNQYSLFKELDRQR